MANVLKIFGVGMYKTGTVSLAEACTELGVNAVHDHVGNDRRIANGLDFDDPGVGAYFDGNMRYHALALFEKYPDATFLITERCREDWINSCMIHVTYNRMLRRATNWFNFGTKWAEQEWARWEAAMVALEGSGAKCHRMRVTNGDWTQICNILGKPKPTTPFPHTNTSAWRLQAMYKHLTTKVK